ncbi:hypothetical protein GCM10028820_04880 [Tessaracoccus terricola]
MTAPTPIDPNALWNALSRRERLARLLLLRSAITPAGELTDDTRAAVLAGVGAFHGPPMLEQDVAVGPTVAKAFNNSLRGLGIEAHGLSALIGANAECGLSYTTRRGGTDVPYPAALGLAEPALSEDVGRVVGSEFAAAGYSWAFQPVVDVRTTTKDPVIGVRAFGDDPAVVAAHGAAYVRGMQSAGILATAKHFPGHGDAEVDSHLGLPVVQRTAHAHEEVHLAPFRAVVEAGVATIMTAHLTLPQLGIHEIATFSRAVCTDLIRNELAFDGLLVTDSLRMAAVAADHSYADAYIASLHAGCDLMNVRCWPDEVPALLDELENRLEAGLVDEEALFVAFSRVVAANNRVSLPEAPAPSETTAAFTDPRLAELLVVDDPSRMLPLRVAHDGTLGVLVDSPRGTDAPPLTLMETIERITGCTTRRITTDDLGDVDAVLAVSYGQTGPTDSEKDWFAAAAASPTPAAALIAGPRLEHAPTALPTVAIPAIDVFGLGSTAALNLALPALVST